MAAHSACAGTLYRLVPRAELLTSMWQRQAPVEACGISVEGDAIAGTGINPDGNMDAWLVTLSNDTDGDGIPDQQDLFPNSDTSSTLLIGGLDTGISNQLLPNGATPADLITDKASSARNKGLFSAAVAHLANEWVSLGYLSRGAKVQRSQRSYFIFLSFFAVEQRPSASRQQTSQRLLMLFGVPMTTRGGRKPWVAEISRLSFEVIVGFYRTEYRD